MSDLREMLDRRASDFQPGPASLDGLLRRARARQRTRRLGTGLLAFTLFAVAAAGLWVALRPRSAVVPNPSSRPATLPVAPSVRPEIGQTIHVEGRSVTGLAYGYGSLWVTTASGDGEPGRLWGVDLATGITIGPRVEFPSSPPTDVVIAAGSVWVADANEVYRIDPVSFHVLAVTNLVDVAALAPADDGVWVADMAGAEFIDARTNTVGATVVTPSPAHDIAVGDGAVWAIDSDGVTLIDPKTLSSTGVSIEISDSNPNAVAIGDGMAWVASGNGSVTGFQLPLTPSPALPSSLAQLQHSQARANQAAKDVKDVAGSIGSTRAQLQQLRDSHGSPSTIAQLEAQLHALEAQEAQDLAELDEARSELRLAFSPSGPAGASTVQVGGSPVEVLVAEGSVWAITWNEQEPGKVLFQIDPARHSIVGTGLPLDGAPFTLAYGGGALWVGDADSGTVTRIDLKSEG
jgi:hypothetical protein